MPKLEFPLMSETIVRFSVSELTVVRVRCKACGAVVELPLASSAALAGTTGECRLCGEEFVDHGGGTAADPFRRLAAALENLRKMADRVDVQFELAADKTPPPKP